MAREEDWVIAGAVLGSLFLIGVLVWAFKKRGSPRTKSASRELKLKPILRNKEVVTWDDWRGITRTVVIEREVKSVKD